MLGQRLDKQHGALFSLRDRDLIPASALKGEALGDETISSIEDQLACEHLMAANLRRKAEAQREEIRQKLESQGIDLNEHPLPELPPKPQPVAMDELPDLILEQQAEATKLQQQNEKKKEEAQ